MKRKAPRSGAGRPGTKRNGRWTPQEVIRNQQENLAYIAGGIGTAKAIIRRAAPGAALPDPVHVYEINGRTVYHAHDTYEVRQGRGPAVIHRPVRSISAADYERGVR